MKSVAVLDRAGMSASLACAAHCAVFPLVLAVLPAAGIALSAHRGGFTVHRRCLPTGVAVVGLLTIVTTICLLKDNASQPYMQASGAVVVASSHFLNRHLCRTCTVCMETR